MKSHWVSLVPIIFLVILSGCASTTGIDPSSLDKTSKQNYVEIKHDFKWEERFSLIKETHYMTLKSGQYKAYLDASNGTYYEGGGACLEIKAVSDSKINEPAFINRRCGIFVPNNQKSRSKVYYYIDPEASKRIMDKTKPGLLIEALDKAEWNNLKHLMHQPDEQELKSAIEVVE